VGSEPFLISRRQQLVALAARHAVPAIYGAGDFGVAGGLISYAPRLRSLFRQLGVYAGKILNGAKPADLPVEEPAPFELVVNLCSSRSGALSRRARRWRASSYVQRPERVTGTSITTELFGTRAGFSAHCRIDDPRGREAVIRTGSDADRKIGPAARSFAADAHDCIVVRTSTNLPDTDPMQWGGETLVSRRRPLLSRGSDQCNKLPLFRSGAAAGETVPLCSSL